MLRVVSRSSALLLGLAIVAPAFAQTALPKDSPFLPALGTAPAVAAAGDIHELAGVSSTGKSTLVCIYDNQAKRSRWIAVNATVDGIKVLSFDAAKDEATIKVGEQQKTLRMRKAAVAGSANVNAGANAAAFATPAPTVTQGTPQPPPAPGSVAQQETEARMLVSDLLEIGIQQRKAYEEAQKKAEQEKAAKK